jgi:hypothetical protein
MPVLSRMRKSLRAERRGGFSRDGGSGRNIPPVCHLQHSGACAAPPPQVLAWRRGCAASKPEPDASGLEVRARRGGCAVSRVEADTWRRGCATYPVGVLSWRSGCAAHRAQAVMRRAGCAAHGRRRFPRPAGHRQRKCEDDSQSLRVFLTIARFSEGFRGPGLPGAGEKVPVSGNLDASPRESTLSPYDKKVRISASTSSVDRLYHLARNEG